MSAIPRHQVENKVKPHGKVTTGGVGTGTGASPTGGPPNCVADPSLCTGRDAAGEEYSAGLFIVIVSSVPAGSRSASSCTASGISFPGIRVARKLAFLTCAMGSAASLSPAASATSGAISLSRPFNPTVPSGGHLWQYAHQFQLFSSHHTTRIIEACSQLVVLLSLTFVGDL